MIQASGLFTAAIRFHLDSKQIAGSLGGHDL
jgi:hypothetical protein